MRKEFVNKIDYHKPHILNSGSRRDKTAMGPYKTLICQFVQNKFSYFVLKHRKDLKFSEQEWKQWFEIWFGDKDFKLETELEIKQLLHISKRKWFKDPCQYLID